MRASLPTLAVVMVAGSALCRAESFAYIERWATGTLTTGQDFESWRIQVVVPDGDDWQVSGIDGYLNDGPTWYYDLSSGPFPPDPDLFPSDPDSEFRYYYTSPHLYPNSDIVDPTTLGRTADGILEPTYVHLSTWFDVTFDTDGDFVVWQGTVLDPVPDHYGRIEFEYGTQFEPYPHCYTFEIPEPASAALMALGACALVRRR